MGRTIYAADVSRNAFSTRWKVSVTFNFNPLNAELKPICQLLALLGGATIVDVSRLRVNNNYNGSTISHQIPH
jgi:hypothetical protein